MWNYLFEIIRKEFPNSFFISEWSNPERSFKAGFDADFVLDHWDNCYHRLARSSDFSRGTPVLKGGETSFFKKDLKKRVSEANTYKGYLSFISGNHDSWRLANCLEEHELRTFYLIMLCLPCIPFIYYGDEIAMEQSMIESKDGGYHRTGARTPMQWDNSLNAGFSKAKEKQLYLPVNLANKNNVKESINNPDSLYHFIKKLISIRKQSCDLLSDDLSVSERNGLLRIKRGSSTLIVNLANNKYMLPKKPLISTGKGKVLQQFEGALIVK